MVHRVVMVRDSLDGVRDFPLPEGFVLRMARPGDAEHWLRLQRRADHFNEFGDDAFARWFGTDESVHGERVFFLCNELDWPIGTAAAWFGGEPFDATWGRVHWVAMDPDWQGRGLSKPLMSAVLRRLGDLGHRRAYLTTIRERPIAIGLYISFGFRMEGAGGG